MRLVGLIWDRSQPFVFMSNTDFLVLVGTTANINGDDICVWRPSSWGESAPKFFEKFYGYLSLFVSNGSSAKLAPEIIGPQDCSKQR